MKPKLMSVFPKNQIKKANERHNIWVKKGQVKEEGTIVKEKAQQLAFSIRNRYLNMKKDGFDVSKLSKEDFEELFGV